jgi:hypothetical protein
MIPFSEEERRRLKRAVERFDLESYIHANFVKVVPSGAHELRVDCFSPNGCAGDDTKAHLWINITKKAWICYKCGYGDHSQQKGTGWIPRLIADTEGIPVKVAIKRLLDIDDPTPSEDLADMLEYMFSEESQEKDPEPPTMTMPRQFHPLSGAKGLSAKKFRTYAHSRGFDDDQIAAHNILYCVAPIPSLPKKYQRTFVNRIIWPLYDEDEILRSVVARDMSGSSNRPKWVNWPDTEPSYYLWPMGRWVDGKGWFPNSLPERVVLTEGVINAFAVECLTPFVARACFGKKISDEQISLLLRGRVKEVILAWDYDAKDKMIKAIEKLNPHFSVRLFPYRHQAWEDNLDFGDALEKTSPVHNQVATEMATAIDPHSPEYIRWAIG